MQAATLQQLRDEEPTFSSDVQQLWAQAEAYSWMAVGERQDYLRALRQALPLRPAAALAAVAAAAPPPAARATIATAKAAKLSPPPPPPPAPPAARARNALWAVPEATWAEQVAAPFLAPASFSALVPIVFDLETTDVHVAVAHAVEIAARSTLTGREFCTLVRLGPGQAMSHGAARVTGLTTAALQSAALPAFREAYRAFLAFMREEAAAAGPGAVPLLVGHNVLRERRRLLSTRKKKTCK